MSIYPQTESNVGNTVNSSTPHCGNGAKKNIAFALALVLLGMGIGVGGDYILAHNNRLWVYC
ncbi:MAG: hypothetical protein WBM32_01635 [Crocosphaera sp.]|jgi:hypothetical protein